MTTVRWESERNGPRKANIPWTQGRGVNLSYIETFRFKEGWRRLESAMWMDIRGPVSIALVSQDGIRGEAAIYGPLLHSFDPEFDRCPCQ